MEKKTSVYSVLQCVLFMLYFVVLTVERVISLVAAFGTPFGEMIALDAYMTVLTVLALAGGWIYLIVLGRKLFNFGTDKNGTDFLHPCIAAGILLLGGMVHTEGTIPPVQFAAYGCLLAAMLLHTVRGVKLHGGGLLRWMSFAYITAFSMAIPVVYTTKCAPGTCALCSAFYPIESIASVLLVALFTVMLVRFYKRDGLLSFCIWNWGIAAALDAVVLGLRWHDEINFFVLIFIALAVAIGFVGKLLSHVASAKTQNIQEQHIQE